MAKMRKITVQVNKNHLSAAQQLTGVGVTETVRIGLRYLILEKQNPGLGTVKILELARQP